MAEAKKINSSGAEQITEFSNESFDSEYTWKLAQFIKHSVDIPDWFYVSEKFDIPGTNFYSFLQISRNRTAKVQMKFALCYHGKRIADEEFKNSFYKFVVNAPNSKTEGSRVRRIRESLQRSRVSHFSQIKNKPIWSAMLAPLSPMVLIEEDVFVNEDLASYLNEDGSLELNIKVTIESTRMLKKAAFKSLDWIDTLCKDFEAALKEDDFKDVTFIIADKMIKAHKAILGARSPVFKAMFKEGTKEAETNVVEIIDFKFDTFKELIYFIYTGRVTKNFSKLAMELFELAHVYQIESLKKISEREIHKNLSVDNASAVLQLSKLFHCNKELKNEALELYKRNLFKKIDAMKLGDDFDDNLDVGLEISLE